MFRQLIYLSLLLCVAFAQKSDLNAIIKTVISTLDEEISRENISEIELPRISYDFGLVNILIDGGSVKNLSTIELMGKSISVKNQTDGSTINFKVGLKTLELHFGMIKLDSMFVNIDDDLTVAARSNGVDLGLKLIRTGDNCTVSLIRADADLGNFEVTLRDPDDGDTTLIDSIVGFFVEKVLNLFSSEVENFLNPQLLKVLNRTIANMDLSKLNLCQLV